MAILTANPGNVISVANAFQAGDLIMLEAGSYGSLSMRGGIHYRAFDHGVGRVVTDTTGHNGQGLGVRVTGPLNVPSNGVLVEGVFQDTRGYNGINAGVITGDDFTFADGVTWHRPNSGARQIGFTFGSGSRRVLRPRLLRYRNIATGQANQNLDHATYWKNCADGLVADSIIVDGGRFPLHLYTNADSNLFMRTIVWNSVGGITFSGASDSSTGTSVYGTSDNNTVLECIFGFGRSGALVETWVSDSSRPVSNNLVKNTILTRAGGGAAPFQSGMRGVTIDNCPDIDPGFRDWRNGDFRNTSGYGPSYLRGAAPPPPPPPPDPEPEPEPPPPPPPDTTPPLISWVRPDEGAVLSGPFFYTANASDPSGVEWVEFKLRGNGIEVVLFREFFAPYGETAFDSTIVPNGDYTLSATARDKVGNETTIYRNVSVLNVAPPPPPDPEPEPEPEPEPSPAEPDYQISDELREALSQLALHRMSQQTGRAVAISRFLAGKGFLNRANLTLDIATNADIYLGELAELMKKAKKPHPHDPPPPPPPSTEITPDTELTPDTEVNP